jgi:hypothetical protein
MRRLGSAVLNRLASEMVATTVCATIGPTPGIACSLVMVDKRLTGRHRRRTFTT